MESKSALATRVRRSSYIACLLISSTWLRAFLCPFQAILLHVRRLLWTRVPLSRRIKTNQICEISFTVIYYRNRPFRVFWETQDLELVFSMLRFILIMDIYIYLSLARRSRKVFFEGKKRKYTLFSFVYRKKLNSESLRSWPFWSYFDRSRSVYLYSLEKWIYSLTRISWRYCGLRIYRHVKFVPS